MSQDTFELLYWHDQIGEVTVADGILDRLVHNALHIELKVESMRSFFLWPSGASVRSDGGRRECRFQQGARQGGLLEMARRVVFRIALLLAGSSISHTRSSEAASLRGGPDGERDSLSYRRCVRGWRR